jgi:hypothetical protein
LTSTGFAGNFEAQNAMYGRRQGGVYVCSAARRKGRAVCASDLHLPIADTEALILDAVERDLLDADVFSEAMTLAVQRITTHVAAGEEIAVLVSQIQLRQTRRSDISRLLDRPAFTESQVRAALAARLNAPTGEAGARAARPENPTRRTDSNRGAVRGWRGVECGSEPAGAAGYPVTSSVASPAGFEPALPA